MKARWHSGDLIRNKESGQPYFVVKVYKGLCTMMFDATNNNPILSLGVLLVRDYDKFSRDIEMELVKHDLFSETLTWKHNELPKIKENDESDK